MDVIDSIYIEKERTAALFNAAVLFRFFGEEIYYNGNYFFIISLSAAFASGILNIVNKITKPKAHRISIRM